MRYIFLAGATSCLVLVAGCQSASVKPTPVSATLAPMHEPSYKAGYKAEITIDGNAGWRRVIDVRQGVYHWERSDGCKWTHRHDLEPALSWENCRDIADGNQTVELQGEVFPLEVGKSWSFKYAGTNEKGIDWSGTRRCEVQEAIRIMVAGTHRDTYKIYCEQPNFTQTWYFAPALGTYAKFHRWSKSRGNFDSEFVSHNADTL